MHIGRPDVIPGCHTVSMRIAFVNRVFGGGVDPIRGHNPSLFCFDGVVSFQELINTVFPSCIELCFGSSPYGDLWSGLVNQYLGRGTPTELFVKNSVNKPFFLVSDNLRTVSWASLGAFVPNSRSDRVLFTIPIRGPDFHLEPPYLTNLTASR